MPSHNEYAPKNPNPDAALKGVQGGNCNREACQMPHADWYNRGTSKYYCASCARMINGMEWNTLAALCKYDPKI